MHIFLSMYIAIYFLKKGIIIITYYITNTFFYCNILYFVYRYILYYFEHYEIVYSLFSLSRP